MRLTFTFLHFVGFFFFISSNLFAQQVTVQGKITDSADRTSLSGVSVRVKGTNTGAVSGVDGNYRITVPSSSAILTFSIIGYKIQEVPVGGKTAINLVMQGDSKALGEVVVTALGISREKKQLGYSAQSVGSAELNQNLQPNAINALQGKVAGVQISSTGGAPGQGADILIRGFTSLDPSRSSQPLFVIDGIQIDNSTSTFGNGANLRGQSNRLADLNPQDIESINILKGGAATGLYGLRGANGVVVITTKSGKQGNITINFSSTGSIDEVNKYPKLQNQFSQGYLGVYDPASFWPSWGPTVAAAQVIDPTHPAQLYNKFKDAYEKGSSIRNNFSVSGGNEKVTFLTSMSQFYQKGTLPFTDYQNLQARANVQVKISPKFTTGLSLDFTNSGGNRYNADRFNESLIYWSERWDVRDFLKPDGTMNTYLNNNPKYGAYTNKFKDDVNRLIGGVNFGYTPFKWLNFTYRLGVDTYRDNRIRTAPGPKGVVGEIVYEDNGQGFYGNYNTKFRSINSTFIATANTKIGEKFKGTLRVGQELYDRRLNNIGVEGDTLTVPDFFNITNARTIRGSQQLLAYRLLGVFGEATLDYDNFLFLTLTGRNDFTSSLLSPSNSFFYPSASFAYSFSDQFKLPSFISNGKLRFSYAQLGKDAAEYSTSGGYAPYQNALPSSITGFTRPSLLGNPDLVPEFTDTYEAGLEMSFLNRRIGFDLTFYYSESKDQILSVPVSSSTGYTLAAVNAGSMRNKGFELAINGTPVKTSNFSWTTSFNISANRNKILSLRSDLTSVAIASQSGYLSSAVTSRLIVGQSFGGLYGTSYQRYYAPGEVENPLVKDDSRPLLIGTNGFPVRNLKVTQNLLGNSLPNFIGGFNNTFNYKNVNLSMLIDARLGIDKYNQMDNFLSAFGTADYTENRNDYQVFQGVLANGQPNTQEVWLGQGVDPKTSRNYGDGYYRLVYRGVSENFIQDASWVRLRSLSLAYNMPKQWLGGQKFVKNASLTLTGNNLILITKYNGFDPESSSFASGSNVEGFAGFTYPALRSYLLTLNVGF